MTLSVRTRLLAASLLLVVVVGGGTLWALGRSLADDVERSLDARLRAQGAGLAGWLRTAGHPERLAPRLAAVVGARVTIVGPDGVIQGDSAGGVGTWIGDAPEILAARRHGLGRARRRLVEADGVVGEPSYLVAVPGSTGLVIRLAVPEGDLARTRADLRTRVLVVSALGFAAAVVLGLLVVRAVTRPLAAMTRTAERLAGGDYDVPPPSPARDEIGVLSRALDHLAGEVRRRVGELTTQRDLLSAVVGELVEGVVVVDRGGAVALINPAAAALIGDRGAAPLPAPLAELVDGARAGVAADEERVVRGRAVRISARPLPAPGGAIAVLYDVTRLQALEDVRRDFLANAAHELRTPVTAISGFAETLLGGGVDDATAREFLATIQRNAARIARLVADLLVLEDLAARPAAVAAREPLVLAPLVAHVVTTARAVAPAAEVEVAIGDDVVVLGDRDRLEQVVQNLIDNAIIHGGGVVRVSAAGVGDRAAGARRRVRLEVRDQGGGIAAEHHDRLFERFYRIEGPRRRGGSGLGLAIVRQQVEAMGGTVAVASVAGQGATFVVELDAATT